MLSVPVLAGVLAIMEFLTIRRIFAFLIDSNTSKKNMSIDMQMKGKRGKPKRSTVRQ